jgi:hypothetical protein
MHGSSRPRASAVRAHRALARVPAFARRSVPGTAGARQEPHIYVGHRRTPAIRPGVRDVLVVTQEQAAVALAWSRLRILPCCLVVPPTVPPRGSTVGIAPSGLSALGTGHRVPPSLLIHDDRLNDLFAGCSYVLSQELRRPVALDRGEVEPFVVIPSDVVPRVVVLRMA